eukprot:m.102488 g.102488  ORF g.102488 m.102488 type:complete len:289 (+) comp15190_c0_seq62:78-944(+)
MPYVLALIAQVQGILQAVDCATWLLAVFTFAIGLILGRLPQWMKPAQANLTQSEEDHPVSAPRGGNEPKQAWMPLAYTKLPPQEMQDRALEFYHHLNRRRTVRTFSSEPLPPTVLDNILKAAGTAPSGAHTQPWHFAVVTNPAIKSKLRAIVEDEERINYERRMGQDWVEDLERFKTSWNKPYLDLAPAMIVVTRSPYSMDADGNKQVHYYHELSTGIACGMLVAAIHNAGLVTVTSTPLNAGKRIKQLLQRPSHEKVVLLLPVGYPTKDCQVPVLERKPLEAISSQH